MMARRVIRASVPRSMFLLQCLDRVDSGDRRGAEVGQVCGFTVDVDDLNDCLRVMMVVDDASDESRGLRIGAKDSSL